MQAHIEPLDWMALDDEAALEMALLLQDETLPGPDLVRGLASRFGEPLWRLLVLLGWAYAGAAPDAADVINLLRKALALAAQERSTIWGTDEIQGWLLKLAVQVSFPQSHLQRLRRRIKPFSNHHWRQKTETDFLSSGEETPSEAEAIWQAIRLLGETEQLIVTLIFGMGLAPLEVASLAGLPMKALARHLVRARTRLMPAYVPGDASSDDATGEHRKHRQRLLGIFPTQPIEAESLQEGSSHSQDCDRCRTFEQRLAGLDTRLATAMGAAAQRPTPPPDLVDQIGISVGENVQYKRGASLVKQLRAKEVAWTMWVLVLAAGAAWTLNIGTPPGGQPLIAPTPIGVSAGDSAAPGGQAGLTPGRQRYPPFSGAPSLSADGRYMAFTSSLDDLVANDRNRRPDVFLHNNENDSIELISVTSDGHQANDWSDWPSISASGRFVAFASPAANLANGNIQTCSRPGWPRWELAGNCVNIYIRDTDRGETTLVTSGLRGERVFGSSLSPVISADGDWLAFWSYASNLVEGDNELCGAVNCMDLFLYNRRQSNTIRIPIGRDPNLAVGNEQLSISADGRYLVFIVLPTDRLAAGSGDPPAAEVRVYDRDRNEITAIKNSLGEGPLEGATVTPQISADGQFIAFASRSTTLSALDRDDDVDVFVYHRARGTTDLASLPGGSRYNLGDSGVAAYPPGLWGERLSISADGRFVAYSAQLLDTRSETVPGIPGRRDGKYIIVRDRLAGVSRTVFRGLPVGLFYEYPSLSADGRWLAFTARAPQCVQACSSTVLLDRSTGNLRWIGPPAVDLYPPKLEIDGQPADRWELVVPPKSHQGAVRAAAFSPAGQLLATGGDDRTIRLWEVGGSADTRILGEHEAVIRALGFSHDGIYLASGAQDGTIKIWHIPTGRLIEVLSVHPDPVRSLAFSSEGFLAVGSLRTVQIWTVNDEFIEPFDSLTFPGEFVDGLAFSPDGEYLAIAPGDKTVWLRETATGRIAARLGGHAKPIQRVAFSPDGQLLATGANDARVNIWELDREAAGELTVEFQSGFSQNQWVTGLAFLPATHLLAASTLDGELAVWDVDRRGFIESGLPRERIAALALAVAPDGNSIAVTNTSGVTVLQKTEASTIAALPSRYFTRLETDKFQSIHPMQTSHPLFPAEPAGLRPSPEAVEEIRASAPFELLVPGSLPEGFTLRQIRWPLAGDENLALLVYERSTESASFEQLIFQQGRADSWIADKDGLFGPGIGASAVVKAVPIGGETAEFVSGSWSVHEGGFLELVFPALYETLVWDALAPSGHLRWQRGDLRYGLTYLANSLARLQDALGEGDLILIANNLQAQ